MRGRSVGRRRSAAGIVEARITDADSRQWSFLDKVAIFDMEGTITRSSDHPHRGLIRCEVLDDVFGDPASTEVFVTTLRPDAECAAVMKRIRSEAGRNRGHSLLAI